MTDQRPTINDYEIPDLLANLVERSLVICDPITGRYHMSESMRVYASDQLADQQSAMEKAHFKYFQSKAEGSFDHIRVQEDAKAFEIFKPEVDNFRHAFEWVIANEPENSIHFIRCLGPSWFRTSRAEAESLIARTFAAVPEKADEDHIALRMQLARGKLRQHLFEEAKALLKVALEQANETEVAPFLHIYLIITVGVAEFYSGNNKVARERTIEALNLAKKHGIVTHESAAMTNLGEISRADGDFTSAIKYYEEGLQLSSGDLFHDALVLFNLGSTALELNEVDRADAYFRKALSVQTPTGLEAATGPLGGLGYICVLKGRYRDAGHLMGFPQARREKSKSRMDPVDERMFEHYRKLGSQLGGKEFDRAFAEGASLTSDQLSKLIADTAPPAVDGDNDS